MYPIFWLSIIAYPIIVLILFLLLKYPLKINFNNNKFRLLLIISWIISYFIFTVINVHLPYYNEVGWSQFDITWFIREFIGSLFVIIILSFIFFEILKYIVSKVKNIK
jgi:hypothetical protein